MCGIAGYLGPGHEGLGPMAERMARSLRHRGPDDQGIELISAAPGRNLALVHRRLAIIDLSPLGHQPMPDEDRGNWLVFNGEIYNYRELHAQLCQHGIAFRSQSDTEVLLKGLAHSGRALLDSLYGMFAFAFWDADRRELLLAVDPLGIKPLYYWQGPGGLFLFASELRALLATGLIPRRLDAQGLESYLSFGAVQAPNTIIEQVHSLLPGTYLTVSAMGELNGPRSYWTPPFPRKESAADAAVVPMRPAQQFEEQWRALLEETVGQHLVSDVPLGIFLSGGVDSSAIVALAARQASGLRTFSVTFEERGFSEAQYSRQLAALHATEHTEISLSESDLLAMLPGALDSLDQPTLDGTNVYVISKAVRGAGLAVALSGQGGDEVFGGYETFRMAPGAVLWRNRLRVVPEMLWHATAAVCAAIQNRRRGGIEDKLSQFLAAEPSLFTTYFLLRQNFPLAIRRALFPVGAALSSRDGLPVELAAQLRELSDGLDPVNQVSLLELRTYLSNMLLRDGDVMSMAHSLEVRVPFLDRRVVDLIARLPGSAKMDPKLPKPLLLRAVNGGVPPAIYQRPKQGFTFPWPQWLRNQLRSRAEDAIHDSETFRAVGIEPRTVERLWQSFMDRRPGVTWARIWSLIVLREWACRNLSAP